MRGGIADGLRCKGCCCSPLPWSQELEALRMVAARAARDGRQGDNAEYGAKVGG